MMLPLSAPFAKGFRRLVGNRAILFGIIILAVVVLTSLLAPLITPYSPAKLSIANRLKPPSGAHLFGTDKFGRDIFTRAVFAGRVSLLVSLGVVCIATVLGVFLGLLAGYFRRLSPQLIVADEAVSALDVSVKTQVANLILDLQERMGLAYLFISHDMAVVERISHRVAVMYLGEIVEIGPRHSVFGNPRHPYTQRLIDAVPLPDPARRGSLPPKLAEELRSPLRRFDYVPPRHVYKEVAPGHFVPTAA